ncbi:hypothetical protein KJ644_01260 [Candidatus Dependentiae bacterium]|nr:hypothetical protein [Candidatus Dependentiae bacterium]MBU4387079.1 hypothetical protein [Candidatus Dependentiae bacterium]MCG2756230.1 hypothetical protein [Candidatus Dependentiae bacterium]
MIFLHEPITVINLILCSLTAIFSFFIFRKTKDQFILKIALAFCFFALAHLITLFQLNIILTTPLIIIRTMAYLLIIWGIYKKIDSYLKLKFWGYLSIFIVLFSVIFFISSKYFLIKLNLYFLSEVTNFILCLTVILLGYLANKNHNFPIFKYIAIGFAIFAFFHLIKIVNMDHIFFIHLIITRLIAYFIIFAGIYSIIKAETLDKILLYASNVKVQITIITLMVAVLVFLFYKQNKTFSFTDPKTDLKTIKAFSDEKNINEIRTGIFIKNFPEFDIVKNEFTVNAIVWFEFDPNLVSLDKIKSFSFDKGNILKQEDVQTKIINDKLWAYFEVIVSFSSNLDYKLFPLEDHKIYLKLLNNKMDPNSEILVSYNTDLQISEEIFTNDWKIINTEVEYGYSEEILDKNEPDKSTKYPIVSFELDFQKSGIRKTLAIFLPLYMVFFLSLFSLILNTKDTTGILSLSVGSTSALIFDLVAIENMSPNVRYFTVSNTIYTILLISSFIVLLLNIYTIKSLNIQNPENEKNLKLFRSYFFIFFILSTILTTYALIFYK